jgi:hypothetical protein
MKKRPFYKAKPREIKQISDKAIAVISHNGQEDILPVSQVRDGFDCLYIPVWLAEQKNVQCAAKKYWF